MRSGEPYFEKGDVLLVSIDTNGAVLVGPTVVPAYELATFLARSRAEAPALPLEIRADRRVPTGSVLNVLRAAREAGYSRVYVFGQAQSLLEAASREQPR